MNQPFTKSTYQYTMLGILFGCCFPILASIVTSLKLMGTLNWSTIINAQSSDPLLWIINTAPIFLGLFAYFIGKEIDIIKAKNLEISIMNQHLKDQEQIALIGKMTAGIAHDLKNPLNFVLNFSEGSKEIIEDLKNLLLPNLQPKEISNQAEILALIEELAQNAVDINENAERANHIVFDLMNRTNQSKQEVQKIDLNELLEKSMQLSIKSFKANHPLFKVTTEKEYAPNLGCIMANANSLNRVFINLLQNACDALLSKEATQLEPFTPTLSIQTAIVSGGIQVKIKDNGSGIPTTSLENVFSPFFTTKPQGQGHTGLGLSICQEIIANEYQGQLSVISKEGQFTEFHIFLPYNTTEQS